MTSTARGMSRRAKTERGYDLPNLREWAAANNVQVPQRGRIAQTTVDQYLADSKWQKRKKSA